MIARKMRRELLIATCAIFVISHVIFGYTEPLAIMTACLAVFCIVPDVLLSYFTRIDVSPSGERAVIISMTPTSYESKFIEVKNGKVLYKLAGKSCFLGKDRIVQIKGSQLFILHADTCQVQRTLDVHGMSEDNVVVRASRSGKWIIIHMDDSIRIIDEAGVIIHELFGNYCCPVFTPNERYLALIFRKENALKVIDLAGEFTMASIRLDAELTSCTVTPDGNTVIAADSDGRVYFFKLEFSN